MAGASVKPSYILIAFLIAFVATKTMSDVYTIPDDFSINIDHVDAMDGKDYSIKVTYQQDPDDTYAQDDWAAVFCYNTTGIDFSFTNNSSPSGFAIQAKCTAAGGCSENTTSTFSISLYKVNYVVNDTPALNATVTSTSKELTDNMLTYTSNTITAYGYFNLTTAELEDFSIPKRRDYSPYFTCVPRWIYSDDITTYSSQSIYDSDGSHVRLYFQ